MSNTAEPLAGRNGGRHAGAERSIVSPELVEWAAKWLDFAGILFAAFASYALYFSLLAETSEAATARYILTALLAATFFRIGFRRIGARLCGWCRGARGTYCSSASSVAASTRTGFTNCGPPCTTR